MRVEPGSAFLLVEDAEMVKVIASVLLMISIIAAPLGSKPTVVQFQAGVPAKQAVALLTQLNLVATSADRDSDHSEWFYATYPGRDGLTWTDGVQIRNLASDQFAGKSAARAELSNLSPTQIADLQHSPLVARVDTASQAVSNLFFFLHRLTRLGRR